VSAEVGEGPFLRAEQRQDVRRTDRVAVVASPLTGVVAAGSVPDFASPMRVGVYRNSFPQGAGGYVAEAPARAVNDRGRADGLQIVHWFALWGGWKSEITADDLDAAARVGATPLITWEPWAGVPSDAAWTLERSVLSGDHDDYIRRWAITLRDFGRPVLLRFAHEMHDHSYPWAVGINGNTAFDYRDAWLHVHAIFAAEGADNVEWVWNPNTMAGATEATYLPIYGRLYPGDAYVDWVGLDIYNGGDSLPAWGGWRTFGDALAEPYAALTSITAKPLILAEVGSADAGGSKAEWIRDAFATLAHGAFPRVAAVVWFDVDKEARWSIASSPDSREAWFEVTRGS
jgi:beta-mannanase